MITGMDFYDLWDIDDVYLKDDLTYAIFIERKQTNHFTHYDYHISDVPKQVKPHRKLMSPRSGYRGVKRLKRN